MKALFKAGGIRPGFSLGDWHQLTSKLDGAARERALAELERVEPRHRARQDAEALLFALAHGIGVVAGLARDLKMSVGNSM